MNAHKRSRLTVLPLMLITACGGGGDSADPMPTAPDAVQISFVDTIPADGTVDVAAFRQGFEVVHTSPPGSVFDLGVDCAAADTFTVRRDLVDHSNSDGLVNHKFSCPDGPGAGTEHEITVRANVEGELFEGSVGFATDSDDAALSVVEEKRIQRDAVEALFDSYIEDVVIGEFELPFLVEQLLLSLIVDLAGNEWDHLADPDVLYDVVAQTVEYSTISPDGSVSHSLSGLVAFPDLTSAEGFERRDRVILLNHATGSTPSALSDSDAWYILANLLAGHGYLVVAPDNYGRGSTEDSPETYLLGNRTGANAIDLVSVVLASGDYVLVHADSMPMPLSIIGYSQGGHSAVASWLEAIRHHRATLLPSAVHVGGAPLNLYGTFRGVLEKVEDRCSGEGYCDLVDPEVQVPFATDRILPGVMAYTNAGVVSDDIIDGDGLKDGFASAFLDGSTDYDRLRMLLQLNSYTNIANPSETFNDEAVTIHLYHSDYDRLVPVDNTGWCNFCSVISISMAAKS